MSKAAEKEAQPSVDMEALQKKKLEDTTFADLVRFIVKRHLDGGVLDNASHLRLARVCEYTQAAVDTILREEHPDHRKLVLEETTRRMERYHGA